ncbi:MAG TPA: tryptophan 7-halogenase [Polyangiaceae bacterium]|nr:tryptophan 7-halogenase [Polyangiaceae bacterium]
MASEKYDVAILGSGMMGATLAAILAKNGVRTLLVEQGVHPRFAIGESTVPETTFLFRVLAARYGVPELKNFGTYSLMRRYVGSTSGVKRNFSFVFHRAGEPHRPTECSQMPTLGPPLGPDMHLFRQDADSYLLSVAAAAGAEVRQQTEVTELVISDAVHSTTRTGAKFEAEYVVDAGGINAPVARAFGLRESPSSLRTVSRTLFTHMIGVKPFDACMSPRSEHGLPSPLSEGTLHHFFEGGWIWVIPFDNHPASTNRLCSVGLTLDPRIHPPSQDSPEAEFRAFIARFPSIAPQFADATAIRAWTRSDRVQFSSTRAVGDRFCLVPHAFGFVDPLFSTGLTMSLHAVNMLAWRLIQSKRDGNYGLERFLPIDERVKLNLAYVDQLVSGSYIAFANFHLWNAWYRVWALGTVYGGTGVMEPLGRFMRTNDPACFDVCEQAPYQGAQASEFPQYRALFDRARDVLEKVAARAIDYEQASARIFELIRESGLWPRPWGALSNEVRHPGAFTLPKMGVLANWMTKEAPDFVRRHYFVDFGPKQIFSLLAEDVLSEAQHDAGSFSILMRDLVQGYNFDWRRRRSRTS